MKNELGNDLTLGITANGNPLTLSRQARGTHLYISGATGSGKTKLVEYLIRQDVVAWRKSKCGLLLLDPHGSLCDSLLAWMAWHDLDRPVVSIDLRDDGAIVSYNVLRPRSAKTAVVVRGFIGAMAHAWGQADTVNTPLFSRWAANVLWPLYEKQLTLAEAAHLTDFMNKRLRVALTENLQNPEVRQDWEFANALTHTAFEAQISSTVNRLRAFKENAFLRCMFGQTGPSLDFGRAIEEGWIILCNLSAERGKISSDDARVFGSLVLHDLWMAAQERGKRAGLKPFYCYADEFQRFVSPALAENLAQARGFGLHLTMAHQFPTQLLNAGPTGKAVFDEVMANARSKIVFQQEHPADLKTLAEWLFRGVFSPDKIKHELYGTKVMAYREELRRSYGRSTSQGHSHGANSSESTGEGRGGSTTFDEDGNPVSNVESMNHSAGVSSGESDSWSESETTSITETTALLPVLGKELASVQFEGLDEQVFRAMAVLVDQEQRQFVARLTGMRAPVSVFTPNVQDTPASAARRARYIERLHRRWPFVLPFAEALKKIMERQQQFKEQLLLSDAEPSTARRRVVRSPKPAKVE